MKTKILKTLKEYPITISCILLGIIFILYIQFEPLLPNTMNQIKCYLALIYNPKVNRDINFSLGEAIATVGLIFAVLQLLNKRREITLRIKGKLAYNLWWMLAGIGLISIFISSIVLSGHLFWEQVGFLFFILSPFSLWYFASKHQHIYQPRNAKSFYHTLLRTASTGNQEDLEIVTTLLLQNLDELIKATKEVVSFPSERHLTNQNLYYAYAHELLNSILTDKQVVDYIVTSRIDFLLSFIQQIKENHLPRRVIGRAVDKLIERLFENTESYLYKQLEYGGLSLYAPIYDAIFLDLHFINEFSVLKTWVFSVRELTKTTKLKVQVFIKALEKAIEASQFQDPTACQEIAFMLHELVESSRSIIWYSGKTQDKWGPAISPIEFFFGHTFPEKYKVALNKGTVSDYEQEARKGEIYNQSLTASYSLALVEFLGELTRGKDQTLERSRAMSATRGIFLVISRDDGFDNIRNCFISFMWDKIKENVEMGFFPPTLRIYIELLRWKGEGLPTWYLTERNRLIKYLYENLIPRILKNEKMANYKDLKEDQLLPKNIVLDKASKIFFSLNDDGSKTKFE